MTATQAPTPGPLSGDDIGYVRDYWSAICDSDWHLIPADIRDDLEERLVAVGLAEWRAVTDDDLEDTFAYERGIEKGRSCLDLTAPGHLAFKSDADGWMPWSGGLRPIPPSTRVGVRFRDGREDEGQAAFAHWWHEDAPDDVIAFRLAPTAPVEASGLERDYTDAEILGDTVPADLLDGEIVAFGLRMEGTAGLYPSIRNTQEGAAKLAARLAEESPENPPYIPVALSLRPQPSGQPSGFIATLTDDQRAETLAYTGDDTHPQPSGETREHGPKCWGKTSLSDEMAHCYCGSTDLRPQPSGETREQCAACSRGEVTHFSTDDGFWVEITTSAGGANEHGLNGWFETLEHYPDGSTKRREYVATDSPALSTTPARAEAQDEGAAGKREQAIKELIAGYAVMHEVICFMAGTSGAAGRWYYEKANAAFEKVKPLHVFGNDLATHPSPTPAADADRVRIAVEALEDAAHEAHGRGYVQGFADAVWDDTGDYDEKALTENLDPEKLRDGWYDDARHTYRDAQTKALAALKSEAK